MNTIDMITINMLTIMMNTIRITTILTGATNNVTFTKLFGSSVWCRISRRKMDALEQLASIGRRGPGGRGGVNRVHEGHVDEASASLEMLATASLVTMPTSREELNKRHSDSMSHGRTEAKLRRKCETAVKDKSIIACAWNAASACTQQELAPGTERTPGRDCRTQEDSALLRGAFEAASSQGPQGHAKATNQSRTV